MPQSTYEAVKRALKTTGEKAAQLERQRRALEKEIARLAKAGLTDGKPHFKEGKYLVLVHPQRPGAKRVREYIGNDETRIAEALAAVERTAEHAAKRAELNDVNHQLIQLLHQLTNPYYC